MITGAERNKISKVLIDKIKPDKVTSNFKKSKQDGVQCERSKTLDSEIASELLHALDFKDDSVRRTLYKELFLKCGQYVKGLTSGESIDDVRLFGHSARITAIYYHNGKLASGTK